MFDLEQRIKAWRGEVEAALGSPSAALELESHLRDEIDRQMKSGCTPENALAYSLQSMGELPAIRREFIRADDRLVAKVRRLFSRHRISFHASIAGLVGFLFVGYKIYAYSYFFSRGHFASVPYSTLFHSTWISILYSLAVINGIRYLYSGSSDAGRFVVAFNRFLLFPLGFGVFNVTLRAAGIMNFNTMQVLSALFFICSFLYWYRFARQPKPLVA